MRLYRFSPIKNKGELLEVLRYTHFECHRLCQKVLGRYLPVAGNVGVFCHYDDEYDRLISLRRELTDETDHFNQKYFRLHQPIVVPTQFDVPAATYTYLYIRKPDPYRSQVGDADFYLESEKYNELKQSLTPGKKIRGARIFERSDIDQVELYDPDLDVLSYVSFGHAGMVLSKFSASTDHQ